MKHPILSFTAMVLGLCGWVVVVGTAVDAAYDVLFPYEQEQPARQPAADLPNPSWDECVIIDPIITTEDPTFISPEPAAISMQIIVYCGQRIPSESSPDINRQAFKYINVDLAQAEVLVRAAADLLGDDGVNPPE